MAKLPSINNFLKWVKIVFLPVIIIFLFSAFAYSETFQNYEAYQEYKEKQKNDAAIKRADIAEQKAQQEYDTLLKNNRTGYIYGVVKMNDGHSYFKEVPIYYRITSDQRRLRDHIAIELAHNVRVVIIDEKQIDYKGSQTWYYVAYLSPKEYYRIFHDTPSEAESLVRLLMYDGKDPRLIKFYKFRSKLYKGWILSDYIRFEPTFEPTVEPKKN